MNAKSNPPVPQVAARQARKHTPEVDVDREAETLRKFREDLEHAQTTDDTSIRASLLGRHE